ncbi:hypothetical protein I7I53_02562 [Histoplasma capsulatum var. duboisii H88]|uniref:Uncharacterized protein n=1 Tax=Ajellomyces capsulatus (strain H88) TaxID=544711 RepID=A0A8A1LLQ5_AJEC8|nr:hypothetical protein I7I53_02562 [Histoplasma capsulatum var. duboisii H88]
MSFFFLLFFGSSPQMKQVADSHLMMYDSMNAFIQSARH